MVNGLYTASRGMMNILAKQDVMANNLANASTTGFKLGALATRSSVSIQRNDEWKLHQNEKQELNEGYTQFSQGSLVQTDHPLDIAIAGEGFLNVKTPEGVGYTRNGGLTLNSDKQLVTLNGRAVLDDNQEPITLDGKSIAIQSDGTIFVDGQQVCKLGLSEFGDKSALVARGDGLYANTKADQNPPQAPHQSELRQGFLEASNVDTVSAMVSMIAYTRNYEADQKAMQSIDQTLNHAVNEVGRVG
jgi:flagellar basal-body rod protein FlgF